MSTLLANLIKIEVKATEIVDIWKTVREKVNGKGRFSKNNFWVALRNPLYCGKIFIPPYKEEQGHFVAGQHQPLISEKTFADVQDILDEEKG
ncbi:recombinase family protein [Albibacterium sp.]|uniref:recombinase family protein n=1 Tax=Albibacterium sp. TaxID=2952885 RepID=UPI002D80F73F|nr:recombinase family protein [Albibacterium sp.]